MKWPEFTLQNPVHAPSASLYARLSLCFPMPYIYRMTAVTSYERREGL